MTTYTEEQALEASIQYFNGNEKAAKIWLSKYCLKDNNGNIYELTPDDTHWRLAKEIARIEEKKFKNPLSEKEVYEYIKDFKYIQPQGSPLFAIGNPFQHVSASNCFVVESPNDSYSGIVRTDEQIAQISKRRGGIGYDISTLRPKGMPVKNAARTTTGAVSFMHRFSNVGLEVGQEGRRGAQMITISVHHPDILDFVKVKADEKSVTGANISVRLSNDFLIAVTENTDYELRWPVDSTNPTVKQKISARKVWKEIIHYAWLRAEPGLLFWDRIISESPADCYSKMGYKTISTNPCYGPEVRFLNENGYIKFKDATLSHNKVVTDNRVKEHGLGTTINQAGLSYETHQKAELLRITTKIGFQLDVTPNHEFPTNNGTVIAQNLTDEKLLISVPTINSESIKGKLPETPDEICALLMGLIAGDGCFTKNKDMVHVEFWGHEQEKMEKLVCNLIDKLYDSTNEYKQNSRNRFYSRYRVDKMPYESGVGGSYKTRITSTFLALYLKNRYGFEKNTKHTVPDFIMRNANTNIGKYYVVGMVYADGTVTGTKDKGFSVRISQNNPEFLREIQLLLHANGVVFGLYFRKKASYRFIKTKEYFCKNLYELISIGGHYKLYSELFGIIGSYKELHLDDILSKHNPRMKYEFYTTIDSIEELEPSPVYCITEPKTNSVIANGVTSTNCGELPLSAFDSCRLLMLNTFSYVENPFTPDAFFDFDKFYKHSKIAQRFMDDIVDIELECIDDILNKINSDVFEEDYNRVERELWQKIKIACENGRRTGTGVTAIGDTIAALGLKYGNDDSIDVVENIYKTLKHACYESSIDMAEEIGPFPIWNYELEKSNPFLLRLAQERPDLWVRMKKSGRRNMALLTTAPVGTLSQLMQLLNYFETTSGIEPLYTWKEYTRRKKINPNENAKVDFIDSMGQKWTEFTVRHAGIQLFCDINPGKTLEDSPYYGASAEEINWQQRVKLQARANLHVDHSISSTVNLPNDVKEEEVANIYEAAWKAGVKGLTVYRDGCRSGVLVTKSEEKEKIKKTDAPKRPKDLSAEIHTFKIAGKEYTAFVGLLESEPYEILVKTDTNLSRSIKAGTVRKIKRGHYAAIVEGEIIVDSITEGMSHEEEALTRMVSTALRHGADISYIVHQLEKTKGEMISFAKCISRTLKKYIEDGVKVSGEACLKCESNSLCRQEGCITCQNCGWSKCG